MSSVNSFGRLQAPKDGRDFRYLARAAMLQIAKPKPRKRAYTEGARLDQGNKPHCVAFAGAGFMSAAPLMQLADYETTAVYSRCQQLDEWAGENYDGTSVRALMKVLQERKFIESYVWGQSVSEISQWTNNGFGTVIVGTNWYAEMSNVGPDGFMLEPPSSLSTPLGGHAWRINWFDAKKNGFLMVNSWGHEFGYAETKKGKTTLSGMAYVRPALLERLLLEDGEIAAPTQVKIKPVHVV